MRSSHDIRRREGGFTRIEPMTAGLALSILAFPFRWDASANDAIATVGEPEMLTLRTIVGRF